MGLESSTLFIMKGLELVAISYHMKLIILKLHGPFFSQSLPGGMNERLSNIGRSWSLLCQGSSRTT